MENYQGDLTDILRAGSGGISGSIGSNTTAEVSTITDWQFPGNPIGYPAGIEEPLDEFGDPFSNMRDPLLHEMDMSSGSCFFSGSNPSTEIMTSSVENTSEFGGGGGVGGDGVGNSSLLSRRIFDDEIRRPGNNIFSRMLQISPNAKMPVCPRDSQVVAASPRGLKPPMLATNDMINSANNSKVSLVENAGMQISSPRNTGIKRR